MPGYFAKSFGGIVCGEKGLAEKCGQKMSGNWYDHNHGKFLLWGLQLTETGLTVFP